VTGDERRAQRIEGAGLYTPPDTPPGSSATHWVEHLRSGHLSVGTYSVAAGGIDDQVPHSEDEVYVITAGRARLSTPSGAIPVEVGDAVFVPAREPHSFVDISEDLAALVLFAPPETEPA
jgi:mannose-6-phosphate isomerase-like protein (cupin superfamily)